jgi:transposase
MALTIVEDTRVITGGVDTHADTHVAAALDPIGGLLGVEKFPVTLAGYARLLGWLGGFGTVGLVGIEGTGSYGAGLARYVTAVGIRVVEVDRSDRQDRRRQGKSDLLTELRGEVPQVSGQIASRVATFADHDHGRGSAAGSVRAVPAGRCWRRSRRPGGGVLP